MKQSFFKLLRILKANIFTRVLGTVIIIYIFFLPILPVLPVVSSPHVINFSLVFADQLIQDKQTTLKAKVLQVLTQETKTVPGTDVETTYQTLQVQILDGNKKGQVIQINNDFLALKKGEVFYMIDTVRGEDGQELYSVSEPYRLPVIIVLTILFLIIVIIFGGIQGIRGIVSLVGGFLLIIYVLLPSILHGYSPILMSLVVASLIIVVGSYITHGFNRTTTAAVVGMVITVIITGALAYITVRTGRLSGFANEESVYLNINQHGHIDMAGLLFGGILIGLLGVLYDIAIGQAISVEELHHVGPHVSGTIIYRRALRIGREHIGALVNTLAIAYVGVSLPLLLLFYSSSQSSVAVVINREIFATEIIRTLIGSIGLVIAVPITTFISIAFLIKKHEHLKDSNLNSNHTSNKNSNESSNETHETEEQLLIKELEKIEAITEHHHH